MVKAPTLPTISGQYLSATQINAGNRAVEDAFQNTLSLDGSAPNAMSGDLDLNNNDLINVGTLDATVLRIGGEVVTALETVPQFYSDTLPAEYFGVNTANTAAANDAAFVLAFAWLNGAGSRRLTLEAGEFDISVPLPAITQTEVAFTGAGRESTQITMAVSQSSGNFLFVGDGTGTAIARIRISGLRLVLGNITTATGYMFDVDGANDVVIEDIAVSKAAGVIRLGNSYKASRLRFNRVRGDWTDDLNHRIGKFTRWTGMYFEDIVLYGGGTAARTVPTFDFTSIGLCDTLDWNKVTAWTRAGSRYGISVNCDNGTFVNADFTRLVLDKTGLSGAAVWIEMTAASTATATDFWKIQNVVFNLLRADTGGDAPGGRAVKIVQNASTTFSAIRGIAFYDPLWTCRTDVAFTTTHTGTDIFDDVGVFGGAIREAGGSTVTNMIELGSNRCTIIGVTGGFAEKNQTASITNFISITSAGIDEFVIANNMVFNVTTNLLIEPTYSNLTSTKRRVMGNTFGNNDRLIAQRITTVKGGDLVISAGVITPTHSFHKVDTEAAAATDDLTSITAGLDGQRLTLRPVNSSRTVTVKDGGTTAGTIATAGDFIMDSVRDNITLMYDSQLDQWVETSRSDNS